MNFFSSTKSTMYNKINVCLLIKVISLCYFKRLPDWMYSPSFTVAVISYYSSQAQQQHNDKLQMWLLFLCCLGRKFGLLIMIKNAAPMMTSYVTPLIEVLVPPTDPNYSKNGKQSAIKCLCVLKYILGLYEML